MIDSGWVVNESPYNGLLWYIDVSFLCYIIYWIVAHITRQKKGLYFIVCLSVFLVGGANYYFGGFDAPFFYLGDAIGISFFFLGVISSIIVETHPTINNKLVCLLIFFSVASYGCHFFCPSSNHSLYVYVMIISLMFLAIYYTPYRNFLALGLFVFLGKISFSIYILHNMILYLAKGIGLYYGINIDFTNPFIIALVMMSIISIAYMWDKFIVKRIIFWK